MNVRPLTILLAARWERLKSHRGDAGQTSAELALIAGVVIAIAIAVVAAIKTFTDAKIPLIGA
ncbi:hypothetical protein J7F03_02925 [Streptomyces sp. ISL-43]|uniref:hypothetical protein n=1 Tax=Streptomyces sp. ISL-43 TaxID=2819183 RepID=UPI001BEB84A7|nr:hypothetical protein [Streptomyces sp. ISL-43]MBT2446058.1 hypothetical protein [Streptomyces sp. ISL-43]